MLTELGPPGRETYRRQLRWDLLVIAANATWLTIWLHTVTRRLLTRRAVLIVCVCGAGTPVFADLIENLSIARLLAAPSAPVDLWISLAHGATVTKGVTFLIALIGAIAFSSALVADSWSRRRRGRG
mgnify:CR=1 FL=1